jgi:hypothetical protein
VATRRPTLHRMLTLAAWVGLMTAPAAALAQDPGGHAKPAVVEDGDVWHLRDAHSSGAADRSFRYGDDEVVHVMGDWDGDGDRTPGVIRFHGDRDGDGDTDMVWYLRNHNTDGPADIIASFGEQQNPEQWDTPVVGDWDGDGVETIGVVRADHDANVFHWLLRNTNASGNAEVSYDYGQPDAYGTLNPQEPRGVPIAGDWDGDGITTPGIVRQRPSDDSSRWLLRNDNSTGAADTGFFYGRASDRPLVGDWDWDGRETAAVHRLPNEWLLTNVHASGPAATSFHYGSEGMTPLVWR